MVCASTLLTKLASVKDSVVDFYEFVDNPQGILTLNIHLHPKKRFRNRCPVCGKCCSVYDSSKFERSWRALDFGGIIVKLYAYPNRISCPEHGVKTASVPWAFNNSEFTKDFDLLATYLAMHINRKEASILLRCDWHTVMRCITRAKDYLEPFIKRRFDNLVNIGIDETSYRKGHNYLTVVVNHDTNTVVWCGIGHDKDTLSKFFEELTQEQRLSIKNVSGDGARWIDACINKYIPHASRCIDAFHVVSWANECVDAIRKQAWHEAQKLVKDTASLVKPKRGRPSYDDNGAKLLANVKHNASEIKGSAYALGKSPEHLTARQEAKLELIAKTHPVLFRAYKLKEQLRLIFKIKNPEDVALELKSFFWKATHSRIPIFKELAHKIRRHEEHILNTVTTQLSNARIESMNNKIKLFIRKAYGFRNVQNMIDLIMLGCSQILIPLPNRGGDGLKVS